MENIFAHIDIDFPIYLIGFFIFIFLIRYPIGLSYKKEAKKYLQNVFDLINDGSTSYSILDLMFPAGRKEIYINLCGKYKSYKAKFRYHRFSEIKLKEGTYVDITIDTKLEKSKIPFNKFIFSYPKVYKDYIFDGNKIHLLDFDLKKEELSREKTIEILDDMVKACEMVENPDFKLEV